MVIRPREGELAPAHDSRLDRYRTGIAVVREGDVLVGHLATRVDVLWTVVGPFWRRRHIDPLERVEWVLVFEPGANRYGYQSVGIEDLCPPSSVLKSARSANASIT